ncbi:MAG: hypothetical protein JNN05_09985 [Candidatus Omnitrophica bacterium]|nr:hypothetical protein [Candidatus Omnitrophota bacterium]
MSPKRLSDIDLKNMAMITAFVMLQCLQIIIILALICSYIPQPPNDFVKTIFRNHAGGVLPEREMLYYRLFVFMAMIGQGAIVWGTKRFWKGDLPRARIGEFMLAQSAIIFLQLFGVFKIFVFENPWWARMILYVGIALAVLNAVFWPEIRKSAIAGYRWLIGGSEQALAKFRPFLDAIVIAIIGFLLFVPDVTRVITRMFFWDQFNRFDTFLAGPAWSVFQGGHLSGSVISGPGFILPGVTAVLSHATGFSYPALAEIVMISTVLYMIGVYGLLRLMTREVILSVIGILVAIKLKLFHQGAYPLVFIDPAITPFAHWPDLFFLGAVISYAQNPRPLPLWILAVTTGVMIVYAPAWGAAMLAAFYFHAAGIRTEERKWDIRMRALFFLTPILTALVLLLPFAPYMLFDAVGRQQWMSELYFIGKGWEALPIYFGLKDRQFFSFFWGYAVALVYLGTLTVGFYRRAMGEGSRMSLAVSTVCVYGLGLFMQYVHHSSCAHYHTFAVVFVLVTTYLAQRLLHSLSQKVRTGFLVVGSVWSATALLTTFLFTYYPNMLSLARNDWKTEKELYVRQGSLDIDAALIHKLTPAYGKAAVLSSFETQLLILAGCENFFEPFPLMVSTPMADPQFRGFRILTRQQLNNILSRLRDQAPEYVFIEKKLFQRSIHPQFYQYFEGLETVVSFLGEHYEPGPEGVYLMALKRKQSLK